MEWREEAIPLLGAAGEKRWAMASECPTTMMEQWYFTQSHYKPPYNRGEWKNKLEMFYSTVNFWSELMQSTYHKYWLLTYNLYW